MPRPAYSEQRVGEIQGEIIEAALAVFRRDGFTGLSLRAIAERMSWTPAALYRYFASKEELLAAIRAEGFAQMATALEGAHAEATDAADAARRAMRAYLGFALDEPELFQLMYQLDQRIAPSSPQVRTARERAFGHARAIAAEAIEAGLLEGDANLVAHALWAGCHGLAALAMAQQLDLGCSYDELVEPLLTRLTARLGDPPESNR